MEISTEDDDFSEGVDMHPADELRLRGSSRGTFKRSAQRARYWLIRLTSCPVPFLSAKIPVIGGRTALEVSLMIVISVVVLTDSARDFKDAGKVLDKLIAVMILLAMRKNLLSLCCGISFDRAIYVHRLLGVLTITVASIHALNGLNSTGIALLTFLCIMAAGYVVKPFLFELFYYSHIISLLTIAPIAFLHDSKVVFTTYMTAAYLVDLAARYILTGHRAESAQALALPGDIVRIQFKACFAHAPGQYCFLRIADIDLIEYHPISISSAPDEDFTSFHIRASGDWSGKLLTRSKADPEWSPTVHIEGPYGNLTVDVFSGTYKVLLLISGGIGVTPNQSIYNKLVLDHQSGKGQKGLRKVRLLCLRLTSTLSHSEPQVIFLWTMRDKNMIECMDVKAVQNNSWNSAADVVYDTECVNELLLTSSFQTGHVLSSDAKTSDTYQSCSAQYGLSSSEIFHPIYFETSRSNVAANEEGKICNASCPELHSGRPNFARLFQEVADLCRESGIHRAGVVVCGPASLTAEVKDLCRQSLLDLTSGSVKFDCHLEVFDL